MMSNMMCQTWCVKHYWVVGCGIKRIFSIQGILLGHAFSSLDHTGSSMERVTTKRRRLSSLAGTKYVTDSALSAILQKLSSGDVPVDELGHSRWSISRAVQADVSIPTAQGSLLSTIDLPMKDGSTFKWDVVDPAALLCWLCQMSSAFQAAFSNIHERCPSNHKRPWSIIVYLDEATPGNLNRGQLLSPSPPILYKPTSPGLTTYQLLPTKCRLTT